MRLTVVTGPPAAGKTTWVREHRSDGDIVIDFDALTAALGAHDRHDAPAPIRRVAARSWAAARNEAIYELDTPAWIIHSRISDAQRSEYERAGAEIVLVDPGIEQVLEQARADGRPDWTEQAIRDWYEKHSPTEKGGGMGAVPVRKHYTVTKVTTSEDEAEGKFTALVSVFGNVDYQGDVIEPGAFDESIAAFEAGKVIPVIWSHDYWQPESIIGEVLAMRSTDKGLEVDCVLDITESSKAAHIFRQMTKGRLSEFSIGGEIPEDGWKLVKHPDDGETYVHILKLILWELGPCFRGANPDTELISTKSRLMKAQAVEPEPEPETTDDEIADEDQDSTPEPDQTVRLSRTTQALLGLIAIP